MKKPKRRVSILLMLLVCFFVYTSFLVSGGDIGARDAKLSIMVGGDRDIFEKVTPLFQVFLFLTNSNKINMIIIS